MGFRNSWMEVREKILIPEEKWRLFCDDMRKLRRHIAGDTRIDEDRVSLRYHMSETLAFPRDMASTFEDSGYYIIHKTDPDDFYFKTAIAAAFLLFRQDCLDENPVSCGFIGDFRDVDNALEDLRDAGVWRNGETCLLCSADIAEDLESASQAVKEEIRLAFRESCMPYKDEIMLRLLEIIESHRPECVDSENDRFRWRERVLDLANAGRCSCLGAVFTSENGKIMKRWFPTYQEAMAFAESEISRLGLPPQKLIRGQFAGLGDEDCVKLAMLSFDDLPKKSEDEKPKIAGNQKRKPGMRM